jgi:hypothetical protein
MSFGKKIKYLFFVIIFGLILFFVFSFSQYLSIQKKYEKILGEKEGLLILDYGNGEQRWFKGEVIPQMTVFDALLASSLGGNFKFEGENQLIAVEDFVNNEKSKWTCYLNGKEITQPLNKITIKPKDKIVCRYR